MAVTRYVGDKFVGPSSDSKPSTVADGATFFETDTKRMYCLISGSWTEMTGDLDDHESTYDHDGYDTHVAAAAPHSGHEDTTNKGAANGYAELNSSTVVPTAQLGSGTADSTVYLRGDSIWASPGSASDEQQDIVGGRIKRDSDTQISWEFVTSNQVTLYNETAGAWELAKIATAPTLATTGFTASAMHDIYLVYSSGTAATLEARAWSGTTTPPTRGTLDGRTVYGTGTGEKEKRLVARVYVDASKYVKDEKGKRYINNVFNKELKELGVDCPYSTDTSETLNGTTFTQWMSGAYKFEFVSDGQQAVFIQANGPNITMMTDQADVGLVLDATTGRESECVSGGAGYGVIGPTCTYSSTGSEGYHYMNPTAYARNSKKGYYYQSTDAKNRSGVAGTIWC